MFLGPTVYPFQSGPVETFLLVVALLALGVIEFVLDGASEGEG